MWAWIYALMIALVPSAPWKSSYLDTAHAIEDVSRESPLYPGDDGPARTAAEIVAIGYFESHFDPNAVGDKGSSIGFGQIGVSNLRDLGLKSPDDLRDVRTNLRAMVTLLRESHRVCRGHPLRQQLAAYATGRGLCTVPEGIVASEHRMARAELLLREHPPYWVEVRGTVVEQKTE